MKSMTPEGVAITIYDFNHVTKYYLCYQIFASNANIIKLFLLLKNISFPFILALIPGRKI